MFRYRIVLTGFILVLAVAECRAVQPYQPVHPDPERFNEEFINTGHVDMYQAMKTYYEAGYDGFFIDDHVPHTHGDTPWGHRGRAFAHGYIQTMIQAVTKQGAGL